MNQEDRAIVRRALRHQRLRAPVEHEFVDRCDFSHTGYAVWRRGDGFTLDWCTCDPTAAPAAIGH